LFHCVRHEFNKLTTAATIESNLLLILEYIEESVLVIELDAEDVALLKLFQCVTQELYIEAAAAFI
jgi:hypothetical protein